MEGDSDREQGGGNGEGGVGRRVKVSREGGTNGEEEMSEMEGMMPEGELLSTCCDSV
ncbi:Hypothetical protein SMAX5B_013674 [Scophthalmus maximus]|uniref:Uncharacterized protein n=1 Tax=Scophthalmus maximus TaxID=52904 RepID=A0A2U9AZU4_SCOMX|nr:Hypothetical protein SMAX5B_013674 [Scophthalmus maximus]